jgi:aminoglycoside phosphotransferase family enzyme
VNGDRRPAEAPGPPRAAAVAETHTATLFFVGDRVYKVKKRVRLPFLDFSTLERRGQACRREVELNRRIAPDVYLGVAEVSEPDGPAVDDYAVVMRRMPPERSLARLAERGDEDLVDHVREIARVVAAFHARADRPPDARQKAGVEAVRTHWHDNLEEMLPYTEGPRPVFDGAKLARARELVDTFLAGRAELYAQPAEAGFVCDGHGDLQAADIYCLDDGPRILDCIEFDDSLRVVDVADDVAFLAMDLERLGAAEAAAVLVDLYGEFSGHPLPAPLVHHYIAYRAGVRAHLTALRVEQVAADAGASDEAARLTALARRLLDLCLAHLEASEVRLVLVGGLPGT